MPTQHPALKPDRWKDLTKRQDQLSRQLLTLSAGHPSPAVSAAAGELDLALQVTAHDSQFAVFDLLAGRDIAQRIGEAHERYEVAEVRAAQLETAIRDAAARKRRLFGKPRLAPPNIRGIPVVPPKREETWTVVGGQKVTSWVIDCPYCGQEHTHGAAPGHRRSHCSVPGSHRGYFMQPSDEWLRKHPGEHDVDWT